MVVPPTRTRDSYIDHATGIAAILFQYEGVREVPTAGDCREDAPMKKNKSQRTPIAPEF
jgi:hypothetical protein